MSAELFKHLGRSADRGAAQLMSAYADRFREVVRLKDNPLLRSGQLASSANGATLVDQIKAAVVLNDLTFLNLAGEKNLRMIWFMDAGLRDLVGADGVRITVPNEKYEQLRDKHLALAVAIRDDDDDATLRETIPLIEGGHLVVQPSRFVMYVREVHEDGSRTFEALDVDHRAPADVWEVLRSPQQPLSVGIDATSIIRPDENNLANVILPYVTGTSTSDLAKIMSDETDLLSEFRSAIRELVADATKKGHDTQGILHDIVRPKIARLERRFQQITNLGRLKVGGAAVATVTLALTSAATGGLVAGAAALAGGSGLLMLVRELAGVRADLNAFKDDPTYLLWRLQQRGSA